MIVLDGCRTEPVGSYLQGLGVWRAVVRLLDPHAQAHWQAGRLVLTTTYNAEELIEALCERFEPVPIASPWNAASGYAGNGKNVAAERALTAVRSATDPRLARLRAAVEAANRVTADARARGWEGAGDELWDKGHKADVVQLCRNEFPDDALPWIDAAVVLGRDERGGLAPTYSRLLGTGGNFGRQDLSSTYVQSALAILTDPKHAKHSGAWLRAALLGDESVPYLRGTVGQFDPGRAGGVQSSPFEKQDDNGFANPWAFLFTIEGTVLFASAAVRREGALTSRVAVPFVVRASTVGFAGDADAETVHAEMWMPEWSRPASLAEIEHLLGEGRAEWGGRPARNGLDFVRAVASLGVDRGITHFTRHVVAERLGQNPLAVPAGRIAVRDHAGPVGLLAQLDRWLDDVRASTGSGEVAARLRQVDAACFDVGRGGGVTAMRAVVIALGRLHDAVSKSSAARDRVHNPLTIRNASSWWSALDADIPELRLAAAFASASDADPAGTSQRPLRFLPATLRTLLTPVQPAKGGTQLEWTGRPADVSSAGSTIAMLAQAHRRRAIPGMVADPHAGDTASHRPVVKGVLSAYRRGFEVPLHDAIALALGEVDDALLGDYLRGLLLLDWSSMPLGRLTTHDEGSRPVVPAPLALLMAFFAVGPLPIRLRKEDQTDTPVVLRPGPGWLTALHSSDPSWIYTDALRRLRAAGITRTVTTVASPLDGDAVTAALLLRVPRTDRLKALRAVAALPQRSPARVQGEST